jgi:hypothetical protein
MGIAHGERGGGGERWGREDEAEGWAEELAEEVESWCWSGDGDVSS